MRLRNLRHCPVFLVRAGVPAGLGWLAWTCGLARIALILVTLLPRSGTAQEVVPPDDEDEPIIVDSGVGYIDPSAPQSQFRFRFDANYDNRQPARADFVWPVDGPFGDGPGAETSVDYQDFSFYVEHATDYCTSFFAELPVRLVNPDIQDNTGGLGDSNVGFKRALFRSPDSIVTFQFRTYIPSGDGARGLGNDHASLEPALLCYHRLAPRLVLETEFRDWIPIDGTDKFAGNVLRYGAGLSYRLLDGCCSSLSVVGELVGWTVLDGKSAVTLPNGPTLIRDAHGDTIVNAKLGLRWGITPVSSLYAGYGTALTEQAWYEDTFRLEFRRLF